MARREYGGRLGSGMVTRRAIYGLFGLLGVAGLVLTPLPSLGQSMSDLLAKRMENKQKDGKKPPMAVEARELVYNSQDETVSAVGDVQLYYDGRVLEADKVTYNRKTRQVFAEGNAKLTEANGQIAYGDRFELTDDFRDGFVDSLRMEMIDKTRFAAARAERVEGDATIFEKGTYTACEACKDDPSKPPLWQVRAKRIIHKDSEHTVYYENATLEFFGVPVAYIPYFSAPDATVKRKSGVLVPHYVWSSSLGYGIGIPYFFNLAPNYDLTVTPTFLSRQGLLGKAEWRQRLLNGSYSIRAAGIFQQDPTAFLAPPFGAANKDFRGAIQSEGRFLINEKWEWGWNVSLLSDKWFLQNYKIQADSLNSLSSYFFQEAVSTLYLTGQGDRSWFDARGYYFSALSAYDWQKQQPIVLPVVDYDRRFKGPSFLQGEVDLNMNITSLSRSQAAYRSLFSSSDPLLPGRYLWPLGNGARLYDTCLPGPPSNPGKFYQPQYCYVNGISGNYSRLSGELAWRRTFIDPIGQSWTPFVSARGDIAYTSLDTSGQFNQYLPNFIDTSGEVLGRFMPTAGVTYRYPFVAMNDFGTHVIEPVAQLIVRPNETQIGALPNEDAQSLIYDDTNLFEVNKFSGYDRVEGGTRANIGAQYILTTPGGSYFNALFGQSYQLAGVNSFATPDIARAGLDSGLDSSRSDYVSRLQFTPVSNFSFLARSRWSEQDFSMKSLELQGALQLEKFSASVTYARYAAQPQLGYYQTSKGVIANTKLNLDKHWYISAGALVDLDGYSAESELINGSLHANQGPLLGYLSLGAGYQDECTTFGIVYLDSAQSATGTKDRSQTVMLRLELRTLGAINVSQNIGSLMSGTPVGMAP